ncbi:ADP-ribosylglycohydrolase family protein [Marinobacter nauticus]|uniref:ADP-ribosylglycohydrolase n=1 Tax=Marinobacter nauticus TaxID=2743 RepID=A0A368UQU9_MARNT|nr:ADP-ribosylglycohydrolase family protein [Marinobacter nauticus]RBP69564.1 ADP-ribosylglycohydrolase [Marinobacter nauticus]RCW31208.1 ADP-ribosylglycohydrolase [Marinobacter nauticus]
MMDQSQRAPLIDSEVGMSDHCTACLLGGAIGDALGSAAEFMSHAQILDRFGPVGITDYAEACGGKGKITDDTQMTLFTAEGLLRGQMHHYRKHSWTHARQRWLELQEVIETVASDLWTCQEWHSYMEDDGLWERYPGY